MVFVGQIAFKELRQSIATTRYALPTDGLLLLFVYDGLEDGIQPGVVERTDDGWREIHGLTRTVFVPGNVKTHRRQPDVKCNSYLPCCARMLDALDLPYSEDTNDPLLIEADRDERLWKLRFQVNRSQHWLMGYPLRMRSGNTSPGKDWTSLLTISSKGNIWSWCDGETLNVYVHLDSIADTTFSKVYGYAS